jgi:hypothetical protein
MRYIDVTDKDLIKAVEKKFALVEESFKLKKDMDVIRDKALEVNLEMGKAKEEINERMKAVVADLDLGEFEEEGSTELHNGKVRFQVIDKLANAKNALRKDKENRERRERGEFTEAELADKKQAEFLQLVQGLTERGLQTKEMNVLLDNLIEVIKE